MTREEAIQWLKVINTKEFGWDEFALQESQREIRERCEQGVREALDMAIEALSERNIARDIATILENEQDMRVILQNDAVNEDTQTERRVDHDRDWIIGCIKHDGFIKTDRFDKANQIILEALSADVEWIPCSERLPLVSGEFLVTLVDHDGTWVSTAQWNMTFGGRWQDIFPNDGYRDISNVIAWKTLPKPYTKGDNDEER